AILNAHDPLTQRMARGNPAPALYFGPASCQGGDHAQHAQGMLSTVRTALSFETVPVGTREPPTLALRRCGDDHGEAVVFPHLYGDHWAYAVLAALTVGQALAVPLAEALAALSTLEPLPGRLRRLDGAAR